MHDAFLYLCLFPFCLGSCCSRNCISGHFCLIACLSIVKDTHVLTIQCSMEKSRYLSIKFSFLKKGRIRHRGTARYRQVQQVADFVGKTLIDINLREKSISTQGSRMPLLIMVRTTRNVSLSKEIRPEALKDEHRAIKMMGEVEKEGSVIGILSTYRSATGSYCPVHCVPVVVQGTASTGDG